MADEANELSELNDVFETVAEPEPEPQPEPQPQEAQGEGAQPEASPETKGETDAGTPPADKDGAAKTGDKHWSEQAYFDEKRKRQELERRLEALEKGEKPEPKQEEEKIDIFADPEKFQASVEQKIQRETLRTRILVSQEMMKESKPDYAEKEAKFLEMVKADPGLVQKMNAHPFPAKFVYEAAAKQLALDAIGDPIAYREKLKAELLAEIQGATQQKSKPTVEATPSLATLSGTKPQADVPYVNPLDEVMEGSVL